MTSPILVTGGTGTLGRLVVSRLRDAGQDVRVLSRTAQHLGPGVEVVEGDLTTGAGSDGAVTGVATVVHCAGTAKGDDVKARHLVRAAAAAGVAHLVFISVVGADRVPVVSAVDRAAFGYFASKRAAERVVESSGIPFTTLRATQFHELALTTLAAMSRLPVVPVPSHTRFQPVAAAEVADRLVALSLGAPAGLVDDLAGPQVLAMDDMLREYLTATGRRRLLVPVRVPGRAARAIRGGANLAPEHADGRQTWTDFLARRLPEAVHRPAA
ncbi:MAG TPA: NAD(P)H-binding protein [Lapillicoccus sp.]|nr:NAD(P)H-binding protein [Lapillicoccus sp.]